MKYKWQEVDSMDHMHLSVDKNNLKPFKHP